MFLLLKRFQFHQMQYNEDKDALRVLKFGKKNYNILKIAGLGQNSESNTKYGTLRSFKMLIS